MLIKDSWALKILQRANKHFKMPIKTWKFGMGHGLMSQFIKGLSLFWARNIYASHEDTMPRNVQILNPVKLYL